MSCFRANVQTMATPPAGATVDRGVEVELLGYIETKGLVVVAIRSWFAFVSRVVCSGGIMLIMAWRGVATSGMMTRNPSWQSTRDPCESSTGQVREFGTKTSKRAAEVSAPPTKLDQNLPTHQQCTSSSSGKQGEPPQPRSSQAHRSSRSSP